MNNDQAIERAESLLTAAGDMRHGGAHAELAARAQVFALISIAKSLSTIETTLVLRQNEVAAHER